MHVSFGESVLAGRASRLLLTGLPTQYKKVSKTPQSSTIFFSVYFIPLKAAGKSLL